jgi:hypothetical protein
MFDMFHPRSKCNDVECSGHLSTSSTDEHVAQIKELVRENIYVTISDLLLRGISVRSHQSILRKIFPHAGFFKNLSLICRLTSTVKILFEPSRKTSEKSTVSYECHHTEVEEIG